MSYEDQIYQKAAKRMDEILASPLLNFVRGMVQEQKDPFWRDMQAFPIIEKSLGQKMPLIRKYLANQMRKEFEIKSKPPLPEEYDYPAWLMFEAKKLPIYKYARSGLTSSVSIFLNLTDRSEFLLPSIKSIFKQTVAKYEIILVGTESEVQRAKQILSQNKIEDSRIRHGYVDPSGDYIAFVESGDLLDKDALSLMTGLLKEKNVNFTYSDEDYITTDGYRFNYFFKPDWSPDLLLSYNYVGNLVVIDKSIFIPELIQKGWNEYAYYDMILQLTEKTETIAHTSAPLYSKMLGAELSDKEFSPTRINALRSVLEKAIKRRKLDARVIPGIVRGTFRVKYELRERPRVSIIIPHGGRIDLLDRCIRSIKDWETTRTRYENYEIIIVYHGYHYTQDLIEFAEEFQLKLVKYPDPRYAFGAMNNIGSRVATGEYLILLNDDTEALTPDWIESMLEYAQMEDVAVVGTKLLYRDGSLGHAGDMVIRETGPTHILKGVKAGDQSYHNFADVVRNLSCVTAACLMIKKKIFDDLAGFDERLTSYDDIDLCLRARQNNFKVIYTPYSATFHLESGTRKGDIRAVEEYRSLLYLKYKHPQIFEIGDPFYNSNFDTSIFRQFMVPRTDRNIKEFPRISRRIMGSG